MFKNQCRSAVCKQRHWNVDLGVGGEGSGSRSLQQTAVHLNGAKNFCSPRLMLKSSEIH